MKCQNCGKELEEVYELTEDEQKEWEFFNCKLRTAYTALQSDIIDVTGMTNEQIYAYFKQAYELMADAEFLKYCFFRELEKKIGKPRNELMVEEYKVWVHKI